MNFTAIDFETANRKRSSACAIGMVKVREGEVVKTYYDLIYPEPSHFEFMNIATHGITPEMVDGAPTLLDAWPGIMDFIEGDVLIAHSVTFEQAVINQYMEMKGMEMPELDYLCTKYMTQINYPNLDSYTLDSIMFHLFKKTFNHHHALDDAMACAELALHNISQFREQDPRELIGVLHRTPIKNKRNWKGKPEKISAQTTVEPGHMLFGKNIAITGSLRNITRETAIQWLVNRGANYQSSVQKSTNYLVLGNQDFQRYIYGDISSKAKRALELQGSGLDISIISEEEFLKIVLTDNDLEE